MLYALDGAEGTLDPAFDAHALLVKHWATAWWERWVPWEAMTQAYGNAKCKFGSRTPSWNCVAGPTAALWLTFERAGWHWTSATTACDDNWRTWDVLLDPPIMVAQAMKQSVRRLRLAEIGGQVPGLIPDRTDAGNGMAPEGAIVFDFANIISRMTTGKMKALKGTPEWFEKKAASLLSAVCG